MVETVQAHHTELAPTLVPEDIPALSDDECVELLARVIATGDLRYLDDAARLIGRLAVVIE